MGQKQVKRDKRMQRRVAVKNILEYIDWCKKNVTIRNEDGTEKLLTTQEAAEFIYLTSTNQLQMEKK